MREMNQDENNLEARLTNALRSMAATSASSAPPEVGDALAKAFRRHHARRRMARRTTWAAALILIVGLPAVLMISKRHAVGTPSENVAVTAPSAPATAPSAEPLNPKTMAAARLRTPRRPAVTRMNAVAQRDDFVPLPSYGLRGQAEDLRIVRLQVSGRALRWVGAPASGDIDDRHVLADFLVGQDGTPYAVRLLRQNVQ